MSLFVSIERSFVGGRAVRLGNCNWQFISVGKMPGKSPIVITVRFTMIANIFAAQQALPLTIG